MCVCFMTFTSALSVHYSQSCVACLCSALCFHLFYRERCLLIFYLLSTICMPWYSPLYVCIYVHTYMMIPFITLCYCLTCYQFSDTIRGIYMYVCICICAFYPPSSTPLSHLPLVTQSSLFAFICIYIEFVFWLTFAHASYVTHRRMDVNLISVVFHNDINFT